MTLRGPIYVYRRSEVTRVIDGDTIQVKHSIDVGHRSEHVLGVTYRLAGINTPELVGSTKEAGLTAKVYLEHLIDEANRLGPMPGEGLVIQSAHLDKYGRRLAVLVPFNDYVRDRAILNGDLWIDNYFDELSWNVSLNAKLVRAGHAVEYWP